MIKYLLAIIAICALVIVYAGAAGSDKLICPSCREEIENGSYVVKMYSRGVMRPVHFSCAFTFELRERSKRLKEKR